MAHPVEQFEQQAQEEAKKQIGQLERLMFIAFWAFVGLFVIAAVLFAIHRDYWLWSQSFNEQVLGTFGDFVGGFIGTILTLFSVYLLVKTLSNQIAVNSNVVITNNKAIEANEELTKAAKRQIEQVDAQIFDSKFNAYMKSYQDAVSSYHDDMSFGKEMLDELVSYLRNSGFKNNLTYLLRSKAAVKVFQEFYAENRIEMSVHMRTLYLLIKMIAEDSSIDEQTRVHYAKCVRGQLTESELFVIRYNCYSPYGRNMQQYVNRFNLLKHLPTMSLLEFVKWRGEMGNDTEMINALDALFLQIRSDVEDLLGEDADERGVRMKRYSLTKRYDIEMTFSNGHKIYTFILYKVVQKGRTGSQKRPAIENALDRLTNGNLKQMFLDFHIDYFLVNNFHYYNGDNGGQRQRAKISGSKIEDDEVVQVVCRVESEYLIVLKYSQLENPS